MSATGLSKQALHSADLAIKSTHRVAHDALDSLRDASHQLQNKVQGASDSTARYIKREPVKAMLIAAATGAALMALISLVRHSRHRS